MAREWVHKTKNHWFRFLSCIAQMVAEALKEQVPDASGHEKANSKARVQDCLSVDLVTETTGPLVRGLPKYSN